MSAIQEMEILYNATNVAVVKLATRKYPGILIQGDSLFALYRLVKEIKEQSKDHKLKILAEEVAAEIEWRLNIYEETLSTYGVEIPYERSSAS